MDLQDYLRVLRKRWRVVLALTLLSTLVAGAVVALTPRSYESRTELFVSTANTGTSADLMQGSTFTQQQMKTYAEVITSPRVLDPVRRTLGVAPGTDLARQVRATTPPDTVLLDLTVTDHDRDKAARVANAVAEQFTTTIQELQSVKAGQDSPVKASILQTAVASDHPCAPRPLRTLALGLVLGLLLGLGAALLRDLLDTSIKGEREVKEVAEDPVIGSIHFDPDASSHPLIVHSDAHSTRAEAFRTLRTNLQFVDAATHPRVLVLTSSLPGEGKTTTTGNLGLTLAASGAKVCIIEGDLRRPRLLQYMGLEGAVGLTSVLIGEADLEDVLQPFGDNLHVLGSGPIPPNPSELLGSPAMRDLLDRLRRDFEYVVIDAPPVLPVTDAAVLATLADGAVLVVGAGVIRKEDLTRALDHLRAVDARLLGLVVNRVPTRGGDGYSYYSDRYAYAPEAGSGSGRRRWTPWAGRGRPQAVPAGATATTRSAYRRAHRRPDGR
ncbi:polysaccharide biosynthesis tyrosine autokinase [Arsenicicoccus dermatophilus]|uniref:polysaccharide biosynthesis tyrosine autokinase n=1 Tax=Arsenicicoccus dermatophilus TaxID=1076331 RepID=UPI0039174B72